jgi:electron transfer flavoprotein alpha subunit
MEANSPIALCEHNVDKQYRCDFCEEQKYCESKQQIKTLEDALTDRSYAYVKKYEKTKQWALLWKALAKDLFEELNWHVDEQLADDITYLAVENESLKQQLELANKMYEHVVIQRNVAWKECEFLEARYATLESAFYQEGNAEGYNKFCEDKDEV